MDGGSWFNEGACPMNTATHSVVVPFPQAFAALRKRSSPFPSAPRYGTLWLTREDNRSLDGYSAPFGIIRPSLSFVLWLLRSCFYLSERFSLEPANMIQLSKYSSTILAEVYKSGNHACGRRLFIPRMNDGGFQAILGVNVGMKLLKFLQFS